MRKIILSLAVASLAAGALSSCGSKNETASAEDKAFADSVATAFGQFAAVQQQTNFTRMKAQLTPEELAKFDKEAFLKGLKDVLTADTTKTSYFMGLSAGMQLIQPIMSLNQQYGYPVDADVVYEAFKKVYMQDSIANPEEFYTAYQNISQQLQERINAREEKRIAESKENKENIAKGKAYVAKMVKEGYTKAPSGIVYKIENAGTGDKVKAADRVKIFYHGKKTDGTIFDETKDNPYSSSASAFIPGFNEALTMLGKGGKMTVVIPGELAYGLSGAGNLIGPNETLVFDIEVVDVEPSATPAAAPAAKK